LQNYAYADVDIWSGDEKRRFSWRNRRGIGERRERGGNMGEEMCENVYEKINERYMRR
jgi:hypothetical protein